MRPLRRSSTIKTLQALNLDYTPVSDKGLELLKQLPNLKELSLDHTMVTDRGVPSLGIHRDFAIARSVPHDGLQEGLRCAEGRDSTLPDLLR